MRCTICNRRLTEEELLPLDAKQLATANCNGCMLVIAIATFEDDHAMTRDQYYSQQQQSKFIR